MAGSQRVVKLNIDGVTVTTCGIDAYVKLLNSNEMNWSLRFNKLKGRPEINAADTKNDKPKWHNMSDSDFSRLIYLFDSFYGLNNRNDLRDALNVVLSLRMVDPVVDALNALPLWDGVPRIGRFLTDILKADDTPYTHEVSRLIFAGGMHRAMNPGCKFDDVPVLVGKQGGGKSSIVRMLNMNDEWFRELGTVDGKEAVESINGGWIIEMSEMMVMTSVKQTEGVKSFITRQVDNIRKAYGHFEDELPRRCCFIGTTNNERFLSDKTGNRRFYPVKVLLDGYELYDRQSEIREYIKMCWSEALHLFNNGELPPYADRSLRDEYAKRQEAAREDDWREGKIENFLSFKAPGAYTCTIEVFNACIATDERDKMSRRDSIEIGKIINSLPDWDNDGSRQRFSGHGMQRAFRKRLDALQAVKPQQIDDKPF